jgi:hypothetical protein
MSEDNQFVDGMFAKEPHSNAPSFVKCGISIKRKDMGNWLRGQEGDWINLQVKESKGGKWYVAVDNFKPDPDKQRSAPAAPPADLDDDIPF